MQTLKSTQTTRRRVLSVLLTLTLAAGLFAVTPLTAFAANKTWTGGGSDGKWITDANWSDAAKPTNSDNVTIGLNATVIIGSGESGTSGTQNFAIGGSTDAILNISDGGTLHTGRTGLGYNAGETGTVTVDGASSIWTIIGSCFIGLSGSGVLTITDGGTVKATDGSMGSASGSSGTVTVSGAGSTWDLSSGVNGVNVGLGGTGELNVKDGGKVSSLFIGLGGAGDTINIGDGGTGGILDTTYIRGYGTAVINFDHTGASGSTEYYFTNTGAADGTGIELQYKINLTNTAGYTVLTGTDSRIGGVNTITAGTLEGVLSANTDLVVNSGATYNSTSAASAVKDLSGEGNIVNGGGLTVQSGTFGGEISGEGGLTKTGSGTLTLSGTNSYTGTTTVEAGTLELSTAPDGTITAALGATVTNNTGAAITVNGVTVADGASFTAAPNPDGDNPGGGDPDGGNPDGGNPDSGDPSGGNPGGGGCDAGVGIFALALLPLACAGMKRKEK